MTREEEGALITKWWFEELVKEEVGVESAPLFLIKEEDKEAKEEEASLFW